MIDFRPRIVILDPNEEIQRGYSLILSSNNRYNVVNTYSRAEEVVSNIRKDYPDIVIMELDLPEQDGIEVIRKLKKLDRKLHILVNSNIDNTNIIFESLTAGASGFILKDSSHKELFNAVDEILNNGAPMSPQVAKIVISSFRRNPHSPLSERETEILQLLAMGKTYKIAASDLSIGIETVKSHVKNAYVKLQASCKSEAIEIAKKNSLI